MTKDSTARNRYDDKNIYTMESVYGPGYLSPGGDKEVDAIIKNTRPVKGKDILDLGCGLGGASIALARDHCAKHVTAADIEPSVLARARELVAEEELETSITLAKIDTGPLPFDPGSFDVVYMTAVSCHIEQLVPFFEEVHRVLTPGGCLIGIEWMIGENSGAYQKWDQLLQKRGLNFFFVTENVFRNALSQASFIEINLRDRTAPMARLTATILDRVRGELRDNLENQLGPQGYGDFVEWSEIRTTALQRSGAIMKHFHAEKKRQR